MIARVLAFVLGWNAVAGAAEPVAVDPDQLAAARLQVDLWLDLGELSQALTLARRGVRRFPDDPAWHRARLDALHAAGLEPWIEAEYEGAAPRSAAASQAFAAWEVDVGRRLAPDPGVEGMALVWARLALLRGDLGTARTVAASGDSDEHFALRAAVLAAGGDRSGLARLAADWPGDEPGETPLAPLAPLFEGKAERDVARARELILDRVDARIAEAEHPLGLLRAAELLLAVGDGPRLEAVSARLAVLAGRPTTLQDRMDGFDAGPAGWRVWEVPLRPRWGPSMLDEVGKLLARQGKAELPWGRVDEQRRMALAAAEESMARGRPDLADAYVDRYVGGCAPSRRGEALARSGRGAEGRALAEDRLLRCVGGTDVLPTVDVAGFEVEATFLDHAEAWMGFGRVADLGGAVADAALAYGIAARLQPDADRVAVARKRAEEADLEVDASGLPTPEALVARLDEVPWMRPAQALQASRARLAKARTAALLAPTPPHLVARVTPRDLCLPTVRERCALERAVAAEALRRAQQPVPDSLTDLPDPGAALAAGRWLDGLERARFVRTAALRRLAPAPDEAAAIARILDGDTGVALGRAAPRWAVGSIRSSDLLGEVVVLSFWASWCRPCFAELPVLDGMAAVWEREGLGVRVLAVSVDEDEGAYRRALGRLPWQTMTVARDAPIRRLFRVQDLPTTVVIDGAGVLRALRVGYDEEGLGWLDEAVRTWERLSAR